MHIPSASNNDIHLDLIKRINKLTQIGLALTAEKDIKKLLKMILTEARSLSHADAGTLYIVDTDENRLRFEILQNDSMNQSATAQTDGEFTLPDVPLYEQGEPNHTNVSSYVALTGEIVNIPNVYESGFFDFTGPRKYDAATGYRSESMLVLPMKNHENDIIGVLQLLNAQNPETGRTEPFSENYVDIIASLASQAAVSLTKAQLIEDLQKLFYAFIQSIATAIDEKSPYTGGHIERVVDLTMIIAKNISECSHGPFRETHFSDDEMEELRLAAWMHDVGKITTPEYVVDKSTKLETIFDRIDLVESRVHLIAASMENSLLRQKIALLEDGTDDLSEIQRLEKTTAKEINALYDTLAVIKSVNKTSRPVSEDKIKQIRDFARKKYEFNGETHPFLSPDELDNLSIHQGTLTPRERKVIENHAAMTLKILEQLPFPRSMANTPEYAASHHEKLDGSGYPRQLSGENLPLQSRILAIADIFEALTAKDRPYKPPMKLSVALNILNAMKKSDHVDPDILDFFIRNRLYETYARKEMNSAQIDKPTINQD